MPQHCTLWCAWQGTTSDGGVFTWWSGFLPGRGSEAPGRPAQRRLQILPAQDLGAATAAQLANASTPHPLGCAPGRAQKRMGVVGVRKGRCAGQGPTPPVSNTGRVWGLLRQRARSKGRSHPTSEVGKG